MPEPKAQVITPQMKLISVNNHFGNPMLAKQQGSTIEVFDLIQLDPTRTSYDFFRDVNGKRFPFTNLQEGKLQPQESFILSYSYWSLIFQDSTTGEFLNQRKLVLGSDPSLLMGVVEMRIENQIVIKELPLRSWATEYNQAAENNIDGVYDFQTKIAFLPLLNFRAAVQFPVDFITPPVGQNVFLGFTLGGPGAIFSAKNNF